MASAIRPNSKSLSVSQGKGRSLIAAKVSAAMEAIEGYHAENIEIPGLYLASEDMELKKTVVDLQGLPRRFGASFDISEKMLWLPGSDLLNQREAWAPYDIISADFTISQRPKSIFLSDSNGLASGNTLCEAQVHGICEVIERDALALFWAQKETINKSRILKLETIDNQACVEMLERFASVELSCTIWDITSDIGIPSYMCELLEKTYRPDRFIRPSFGSGTHLDKGIALSRALTEAAQSRATFISGSRDDQYKHIYDHFLAHDIHTNWAERHNSGAINYQMRNSFVSDSLEEDLDILLSSLSASGISEALSFNLAREEFGIPVCKIVIPHLESINGSEKKIAGKRLISCH